MRTKDPSVVLAAIEQVKDDLKGLPPEVWLKDDSNLALYVPETGDVALFEKRSGGAYCGHYFFRSRGKKAVEVAKILLSEFFSSYGNLVIGFTPLDKKGAVWLTRHLGFTVLCNEDIDGRPHMVSVMTKENYE